MSPDPGAICAIVEQAEEMRVEPPRPLTRQMPPADVFPVDALGDVLGAAARAIHDRVQAPLAICSQSVLAAAALAVQAHANVELPMGHVRPVSDYFVTVAETGARKSASDTEATWPSASTNRRCARPEMQNCQIMSMTRPRGRRRETRR